MKESFILNSSIPDHIKQKMKDDYVQDALDLAVFRLKIKNMRKLSTPIIVDGRIVTRLPQYEVIEYVNVFTGEIISAEQAKELGIKPGIDVSILAMQREYVLNLLRREVREFALFLLKFRNNRRGITPDANEICKMYAEIHGLRASHVRRNIPKLKAAGILESIYMLTPLFQRAGKSMTAKQHLSEDFKAQVIYQNELNSKHEL
jgi:hypothetical protein